MTTVRLARFVALALCTACVGCALPGASTPRQSVRPFRITVVDAESGRGVPAVELATTDQRRFFTDSAGVVAFDEVDLMGQPVWLRASSFGYTPLVPETLLDVQPGGAARIEMRRENVATRLYRSTGSGIYGESLRLGDAPPPSHEDDPGIPATGMDSAQAVRYRDELFWVFGDTTFSSTPLGNYRASGATSALPGPSGADPDRGIRLRYFRERGRLRAMVDDPHPVIWLSALRVAETRGGGERLFATYSKIGAGMRELERGLAEFDDAANVFRIAAAHGPDARTIPDGHSFRVDDATGAYLYTDLDVRSRADAASVRDLSSYEAFTALRAGATLADGPEALERDASGDVVWRWKRAAAPIAPDAWKDFVSAGHARADEGWYRLVDAETGREVTPHRGSVHWNAYRNRFVMIRNELDAPESFLGEVWYFEGDSPLGPWAYGRKILTHGPSASLSATERADAPTYGFYNPTHHPELDREGGRTIYFEGTFASAFARNARAIPGYDYNQLMHRLELDDPRLYLPVAVYRIVDSDRLLTKRDLDPPTLERRLAFFAPDRPRAGTVAVRESFDARGGLHLALEDGPGTAEGEVRFYCATDPAREPAATWTLFEIVLASGETTYGTEPPAGSRVEPLCRVWPRPVEFDPSIDGTATPGAPTRRRLGASPREDR